MAAAGDAPGGHWAARARIEDGHLLEGAMRSQRMGVADVLVAAREQGIRSLSTVEYGVFEAEGRLSLFTTEPTPSGAPAKPPQG